MTHQPGVALSECFYWMTMTPEAALRTSAEGIEDGKSRSNIANSKASTH